MSYKLKHFYDEDTFTLTYVIFDEESKDAVIIDPVLNYDQGASKISFESIDELDSFLKAEKLNPHIIFETHAHADHLTGAPELKRRYPDLKVAIGKNIKAVQSTFKEVFNLKKLDTSGSQFDLLLEDDEVIKAGNIQVRTIFTPGHTPACSSYLIGDMLFTGDALFMPDFGTGRCDFPKGSAKDLYHSIHEKIYKLPDDTKVFVGHDYQPGGRELEFQTTVGESKEKNIQLKESTSESEFIKFRQDKDATLAAPRLLLPSVQINIDAGNFPHAEENGTSYIKIPIR